MKTAPPLRRRTQGAGVGARRHRLCVPEFSFTSFQGILSIWRPWGSGAECPRGGSVDRHP